MKRSYKKLFTAALILLLSGCCANFFDIAWGTGIWFGEFSLTWAVLFLIFCLASIFIFYILIKVIWQDHIFGYVVNSLTAFRKKMNRWRWVAALIFFIFPIWFFQFTVFGIIFQGFYLRLGLWMLQLFLLCVLLSFEDTPFINWNVFLIVLILSASFFSIASSLRFVTDYPFSLGWSEGNRLWDYSIAFGRARYEYPQDQNIWVLLDPGRQIIGGIPFIFPSLSIRTERLWIGLVGIFPYLLLGLVAFRAVRKEKYIWLATGLWSYLFLKQGPIHPPLIICAILVALAWKSKPLLAILLVALSTLIAYISRYTWTFAPILWFFMMEVLEFWSGEGNKEFLPPRIRSLLRIFFYGGMGGLLLFILIMNYQSNGNWDFLNILSGLKISPVSVWKAISQQPLLWYRLFPNETYSNGILFGLFWAVLPLVFILIYMQAKKQWVINAWQKTVVFLPLVAFLGVGLIVSTKIGGGGDLHNMDMFLIGLFFVAVLAWQHGGRHWLENSHMETVWVKGMIVLLLAMPALGPLQEMRPYQFGRFSSWLVTLTDAPNERALEMYPSGEIVKKSLDAIQSEVDANRENGEILFMDQRQLLAFGYIQNVPLVVDYDKKVLIEFAMTSNLPYYEKFYSDLEQRRFSLIITQPITLPKRGSDDNFGEENNAWVKWVARPLLCYYEIKQTLLDVNIQLLVPKSQPVDCANLLP